MNKRGFTVIELLVVVVFLIASGIVLFYQMQRVNREHSDSQKKTAINAIYYSLEEGFYPENKYYPENLKDDTLKTLDPELLTDPEGIKIGQEGSAYRYEPKNCTDNKCASYSLRALIEGESDFVKESRRKE